MDKERFAFVFGPDVDPAVWASADDNVRSGLVEERFGWGRMPTVHLELAVVRQLLEDRPPVAWATATRLAADGMDIDDIVEQQAAVLHRTLVDGVDAGEFDDDVYAERLVRLPLPSPGTVAQALFDIVDDEVVVPTGQLVADAAESLGLEPDDAVGAWMIECAEEDLADDFGPHAWLHGERTASVARLRDGIVLTHVLTEAERELGLMAVSFDLAGFVRCGPVTFEDEVVDVFSAEPGHVAWRGRQGWLDRFAVGTCLEVRVLDGGTVELRPVPELPAVDPRLVADLRGVYDEAVAEHGLPVAGEDLVLGLLADDPDIFQTPQAPLDVLCHAAGLERRGSAVAHDRLLWARQRMVGRLNRVLQVVGEDTGLAGTVLDVLQVMDELDDGLDVEEARIQEALDALRDIHVLGHVTDELLDGGQVLTDVEAVTADLVAAARRGPQRAAARLLAAFAAESCGDWVAAEQHLELAVDADPRHAIAVDRLAWYASDRGDAERAARLWRTCPPSPMVEKDLATVEHFARAVPDQRGAGLGRNDRCWCGSGRKHKQCHLGRTGAAALPDRVGWLCHKAVGYLERADAGARTAFVSVAAARAVDEDDLSAAMGDPLVADLVLHEAGWLHRFLADRGHLLPDDEALLAASWSAVDRTVYEVTVTTPRVGVVVRDLRTGDVLDAREPVFSASASVGTLVCGRAVPDGESHQFIGGLLPVAPGAETAVLDLLDEGDPYLVAEWAADLHRPPELRARENRSLTG